MAEKVSRGKQPVFKRSTESGDVQMFCPDCGEEINAVDVEAYLHCPFCNCILKQDDDFDDFLLEGVARAWINKNNRIVK